MKQQYRHTRPYRGKDPNFDTEELNEANDTINEAKEKGLVCIRRGGYGGSHLEGDGYLPCYACGDSGLQSYDSWQLDQSANWEEISCTTV